MADLTAAEIRAIRDAAEILALDATLDAAAGGSTSSMMRADVAAKLRAIGHGVSRKPASASSVGALLEARPIVEYQIGGRWCQQSAGRIRRWRDFWPGHPLHGWGPWADMGAVARDDDHLPGRIVPSGQAEEDPKRRGPVVP